MAPRVIQSSTAKVATAIPPLKKNLVKLPVRKKIAADAAPDYWQQAWT